MRIAQSPQLVDNQTAAKLLDISPNTLTTWRCRKTAQIPYLKVGRSVRYEVEDLIFWLASRKVNAQPTAVGNDAR